MLLDELILHNFGVYRGRHRIELRPPSDDRPIILVGGLNGRGKTTLLDAIQLALYGRRSRCSNRGSLGYEEFLVRTIHRGTPPREGAAVELAFTVVEAGQPVQYRIHRSWNERKTGARELVEAFRDDVPDKALTNNWAEHIEELLPLDIASLFFFDGEKIEALADPDRAGGVIESAIAALLGLGVIDRLQRDLVVLERRNQDVERDSETARQIDQLEAEVALVVQQRDDALQRRAAAQTQHDRAVVELQRAEGELEREGGALFERRAELERSSDDLTAKLDAAQSAMIELAATSLPLALVRPLMQRAFGRAQSERDARRQADVLEVLEARDRKLIEEVARDVDDDALRAITEFLDADRTDRAALTRIVNPAGFDVETVHAIGLVLETELPSAQQNAAALLTRCVEYEHSLDTVQRQLAGVPGDDVIANFVERRATALEAVSSARARTESADEEVGRLTRQRDHAVARLERAREKQALDALGTEDAQRIRQHAQKVRKTLQQFRIALREQHIDRIEEEVLACYRQLLGKPDLVMALRLDLESAELTLETRDGRMLHIDRLSAGERQLLAVALLWGLARVAGRNLPTIVDTPLGRLDSVHRGQLVERYFPYAARQVILLSTDEEIDANLVGILQPHIGRTYRLEYDEAMQSTTVSDGYFWSAEVKHVA